VVASDVADLAEPAVGSLAGGALAGASRVTLAVAGRQTWPVCRTDDPATRRADRFGGAVWERPDD
jgi:hypothetical protein